MFLRNYIYLSNIEYEWWQWGKVLLFSNQFHQKIDRFLFDDHRLKSIYKHSLEKMYLFSIEKLTCLYGPMELELDEHPTYSDKNQSCLRHKSTEIWDVFMDTPIASQIMSWLLGYLNILLKYYLPNFLKLKNYSMSQNNNLK